MEKVDIREITFAFSLDIINLYKRCIAANEYVLSKQMLKSGTSLGANVEEAQAAQTKNDFIAKMAIASKEARETKYWLRLIKEGKLLDDGNIIDELLTKSESITNIITKIVKTAMRNKNERK
ncbi:MAG: four helix bundle protein [Nitrospirota bacterium]